MEIVRRLKYSLTAVSIVRFLVRYDRLNYVCTAVHFITLLTFKGQTVTAYRSRIAIAISRDCLALYLTNTVIL
jgi:hypothetical protein